MSKTKWIIIIAGALLFVGAVGGGFFFMWNRMLALGGAPSVSQAPAEATPGKPVESTQLLGPVFSLETFIVNLSGGPVNHYLRVTMDLETNSQELSQELKQRLPQIRDGVLMILPGKHTEDIQSAEGKMALREEIMTRINSFLKTGKVVNIYFTEFVIQ